MKTTLDINDLWDALEAQRVWNSWAKIERDQATRRREQATKLKALQGGRR